MDSLTQSSNLEQPQAIDVGEDSIEPGEDELKEFSGLSNESFEVHDQRRGVHIKLTSKIFDVKDLVQSGMDVFNSLVNSNENNKKGVDYLG